MSSDLANLSPSTAPAIPLEVLRELPLPGYYIDDEGLVIKFLKWDAIDEYVCLARCEPFGDDQEHDLFTDHFEWRYPKLPPFLFAQTSGPIGGGRKTVTRRKKCPPWCKPGVLFMAWDRSHRAGRGLARGLGVHRVVSVEHVGRWHCPRCGSQAEYAGETGKLACVLCLDHKARSHFDTLTSEDLRREGFPDMSGDEFWQLLERMGAIVDGKTYRISFEKV